jgi:hypothetical protein
VSRWSDLLICEHLALEALRGLPSLRSAASRIVQSGGRTFLEVERFDRIGLAGRAALGGLDTIDAAFLGAGTSDWTVLALRLAHARLLSADDLQRIELIWWFGRLIANSDMHLGNLSFFPAGRFELAPAYDMLPMHYAPLGGGEVPARTFSPPVPLPARRPAWRKSAAAALEFWRQAGADRRISASFRSICTANAHTLETVASRV